MSGRHRDLEAELEGLRAEGLYRALAGPLPAGVIHASDNDYLGLAGHPALAEAAAAALAETTGAMAARLIGADHAALRRLEERIARFKGTEAALLFSSGYQANVGAIAALAGPGDIVLSDALNHASIIDGCRLSRATVAIYGHGDVDDLGRKLAEAGHYRRRVIVTDSIFGMDGDAAPLVEIERLARRHDALLYVDEAHATGVWGPRGQGLVSATGITADVQLTTFGKALGTFGAAVCGPRVIMDYLVNRARTFIFTTALPPALCAATERAIDILDSDVGDGLRAALWRNAGYLERGLRARGLPARPESPIQPVILGDADAAVQASRALLARGFFVQAIRPPTVPPGTSRLRISVSARHTLAEVAALLGALDGVLRG